MPTCILLRIAGEGAMNFPATAKAGAKNSQWMIVQFDEHDRDIFDGMRKSYAYLTKNGLAKGEDLRIHLSASRRPEESP